MSTRATTHRPVEVDPSLTITGVGGQQDVPIDPALFAIEQVVNDVRKGKLKAEDQEPQRPSTQPQPQTDEPSTSSALHGSGPDVGGVDILDEEFDPALREIVNSLTNAQQSSTSLGTNLTQAQAQAAIDAHLSEDLDHGIAFKTLEDLERAGFGMLNDQFGSSHEPYLLPDNTQPGTSEITPAGTTSPYPAGPSTSSPSNPTGTGPGPRRRGRPKGSKNKPKPGPIPPRPPPIAKPAKPRGRPPKKRTAEEIAEIERQKYAKEHGIRKPKGRPRKFPGYLVREMRLKKNRAEFTELQRRHGESTTTNEHGQEFWTDGMEQSILAAVEGLEGEHGHGHEQPEHGDDHGQSHGQTDFAREEDVPSSRAFEGGGDEMEMRRVFGLPADTEHDDG